MTSQSFGTTPMRAKDNLKRIIWAAQRIRRYSFWHRKAINIILRNGEFVEPAGLLIIGSDDFVPAIVPLCDTKHNNTNINKPSMCVSPQTSWRQMKTETNRNTFYAHHSCMLMGQITNT